MGFILRWGGVTGLHARGVRLGGRAIVLCGESQAGKSTTAAALALEATPVLCEDVTVIKLSGHTYCVEPGYAQVRLWPDAVVTLFGTAGALPRLMPSWENSVLPPEGGRSMLEAE